MSERVGFSVEEEVKDSILVFEDDVFFFLLGSEGEDLFDFWKHDVIG